MTIDEIYQMIVAMERLRMSKDDIAVFVRASLEESNLDGIEELFACC